MRKLLTIWLLFFLPMTAQADHAAGRVLVKFHGQPVQMMETPQGLEAFVTASLQANPTVEFAELDEWVPLCEVTPNDPYFVNQWHLPNIAAPLAWEAATGSESVTIAILDTGCDPNQTDLLANYVPGWNFYDSTSNTADVHGHGTMVAGSAGAVGNNGIGVTGVAWRSKIMPLRVSRSDGYSLYSTIATALRYAADHGARVANISISGVLGSGAIQSAAQYMYEKGGVTVCAVGNTGGDTGYAASLYAIGVGATDSSNNRASFSSTGNSLTLMAPGVNIWTTQRGGGFGSGSGTSLSSPIVCGVLALMFSANPTLTPGQARLVLTTTADDLWTAGWDMYTGYGKVNAARAVAAVGSPPPSPDITGPTITWIEPTSTRLPKRKDLAISVTIADSESGPARITCLFDSVVIGVVEGDAGAWSIPTGSVSVGTHSIKIQAQDNAGNVRTETKTIRR